MRLVYLYNRNPFTGKDGFVLKQGHVSLYDPSFHELPLKSLYVTSIRPTLVCVWLELSLLAQPRL